ncbi:MAG: NADH-quinone oxidoreductase subunit H [Acidobacteria bacterium]|nr:NADH-quinone oxidoreductase subunit H [Acidobacteriota bacterium]MBI3279082.1 NADH-quinone oxidoreductase subunit H [Acidobacteriota bacterium]
MAQLWEHPLTVPVIVMIVILAGFPLVAGYMVLVERKVLADMQVRLGPMRVGPHGLLQPIADALKLLLKEDVVPAHADKLLFWIAPIVSVFTALTAFAVLPFSHNVYITDVNVGVLVVSAMGAVGILGIILGGWSSNSHYPLLGALRSSAQLVSYEVALALALLCGVMSAGSLSMVEIVNVQRERGIWFVFDNYGLMVVPFVIYFIAAAAETNRAPFDLPEAESEIVAGFHTEYSGFRWALFMLAEYAHIFVVASVAVTLFWGGWLRPFPNLPWSAALDYLAPLVVIAGAGTGSLWLVRGLREPGHRMLLGVVGVALIGLGATFLVPAVNAAVIGLFWFLLKVGGIVYVLIWFRGTFPRLRYDQLMKAGWRWLIPLGLASVLLNALVGVWRQG